MTVRFKSMSEYQKSYRVSRSRSVSPQRSAPLAGLRSDQMGVSREPGFQHRRRFASVRPSQICSSLLWPSEADQTFSRTSSSNLVQPPPTKPAPPAGSRSCSTQIEEPSLDPKPPGPPGEPGPAREPGEPAKPHPSPPDNQPQTRSPLTAVDGEQLVANGVQRALRWRAGQRSGGERSDRQFSLKKSATSDSPLLTAQQVLYSSNTSIPPFKKNPVSMTTDYRRSFQGLAPPTGPHLQKHLNHQRVALFHKHTSNRKKGDKPEGKLRPQQEVPSPQDTMKESMRSPSPKKATPLPPPPQVHRGHRIQEVGRVTDGTTPQVQELRQRALAYRRRAWGTNFSRDHLSQLLSEHNALWEPTDSATDPPPSPPLTFDLAHSTAADPDAGSTSCVEALDLASSSKRTSIAGAGDTHHTHTDTRTHHTHTNTHTHPGPPAERQLAWGGEEEETDEEEGRLPTPRLKMRPVQRTHHDRTTPATGGAILVGGLRRTDAPSPCRLERCGTAVSMAAGVETVDDLPLREEVWPENRHAHNHKQPPSPASKPIRFRPPAHLAPPPPHRIQGMLRHPDFQHNGELGLKFREFQCPGGGCTPDEDDRLSVMSWHSATSCSAASAILERAQKRRDHFWGKR